MKYITLLAMMICWATTMAQMLPPDGCNITVYELDAIIGDCPGNLCDLSGATVTDATATWSRTTTTTPTGC